MKRLRLLIAQLALLSCLGLLVALQLAGDQRALVDAGVGLLPRLSFSFKDIGVALVGSEDDFEAALRGQSYLPKCRDRPPLLVGRVDVYQGNLTWEQAENNNAHVLSGGRFVPTHCRAQSRVAVIIPYRNREEQLKLFLNHIHPILSRQQLMYGIYVVGQAGYTKFNRALLFNVGFREALNDNPDWECFIFHDVDLMPEDDRNLYTCPVLQPRHMSVAVDTMNYTLMYESLFGGVSALSKKHFERVNGYSNQFWGWGGEDDDMWSRIKNAKLNVTRYPVDIARYTMLKHKKQKPNRERHKVLDRGRYNFASDGLNNLKYNLLGVTREKLYTMVRAEVRMIRPVGMEREMRMMPPAAVGRMKGDEEPLDRARSREEKKRRARRKKLAKEMRKTWESVHGSVAKHPKTPRR